MDVNELITKMGGYFSQFNIYEGVMYVVANFPSKWRLPDASIVKEEFNVDVAEENGLTYFCHELGANAQDELFDSVDFIMTMNMEIEEKERLFEEKVKELQGMFVNLPLDKLKMLSIKVPGMKIPKIQKPDPVPEKVKEEVKEQKPAVKEDAVSDETSEDTEEYEADMMPQEDGSLMSLAKSMEG